MSADYQIRSVSEVHAAYTDRNQCRFRVWAPEKKSMVLHLVSPFDREFEMAKDVEGYFTATVEVSQRPVRYFFKPDGEGEFPDPASGYQPEGVHGPSEVVDHSAYVWRDANWTGGSLQSLVSTSCT